MFSWVKLGAAVFSFFNKLLTARERARDRAAGAAKQRAKDQAEEIEAAEEGREAANEIRTGDDTDKLFDRLRK